MEGEFKMTDHTSRFDSPKLDELVLYISERNVCDDHFGKTKLHKQLWMSDFRHYELRGHAITGATYVHKKFGPFCSQLDASLRRLEDSGGLTIRLRERFGYVQQRPIAQRRANFDHFSAWEIATVEDILWETREMSALQLTNRSHLHPGWSLTQEGEEISYEFARIPVNEPLEEPLMSAVPAPQALTD